MEMEIGWKKEAGRMWMGLCRDKGGMQVGLRKNAGRLEDENETGWSRAGREKGRRKGSGMGWDGRRWNICGIEEGQRQAGGGIQVGWRWN